MRHTEHIAFCTTLFMATLLGCTPQEVPAPASLAAAESKPVAPQAAARTDGAKKEILPTQVDSAGASKELISATDEEPQRRTVSYRADAKPAKIPPVALSKGHEAFCRVKVGDTMPAIELPQIGGGAERKKLSDLFGKKATVVVYWKSDRRMAIEQLADLGPDVIQSFGEKGVAVVGIAVSESSQGAQATLQKAGASFTNLLDADGKVFARVGSDKLPRTYLLDPQGKILWFDIEYSLATRRELHEALRAIAGEPASASGAD